MVILKELTHIYTSSIELEEFLLSNQFFTNQVCLVRFFSSKLSKNEIAQEIQNIRKVLPNADVLGSSSSKEVIFNCEICKDSSIVIISTYSNIQPKFTAFSWEGMNQREVLARLHDTFSQNVKPINLIFSNTCKSLYNFLDKFIHHSNVTDPVLKFVGGVAGNIADESYVFLNDEIYENGVLGFAFENLENSQPVSSFLHTSITAEKISDYYEITKISERNIIEIENIPAIEWFYKYFKVETSLKEFKSMAKDLYFSNFTIISNKHNETSRYIEYDNNLNNLSLFSSKLTAGSKFQIGYLNPKMVLKESYELCGGILLEDIESLFMYSCGIRKTKLENAVKLELMAISQNNICGIFMLGEFCYHEEKNKFYNGSLCCTGVAEVYNRLLVDTSVLDNNKIHKDLSYYDLAMYLKSRIKTNITKVEHNKFVDIDYSLPNVLKYKHDLISGSFNKINIIEILTADNTIASVGQEQFIESCKEVLKNIVNLVNENNMDDYIEYYVLNYKTFILTGAKELEEEQFDILIRKIYDNFSLTTSKETHVSSVARFVVVHEQNDMLRVGTSTLYAHRSSQDNFITCKNNDDEEDILVDEAFYIELLKKAIEKSLVVPHYQGLRNNKLGIIDKYEALMRIVDDRTYYPDSFMEIAKKFKLYNKISRIMIEKVLDEFEDRAEYISINISLFDIECNEFREFLINRLKQYDHPGRVIIEFLETEDCKNLNLMQEFIKEIHEVGSKIAIDDFGSGYSTFATIANLSPDYLKIDGSIVSQISINETNLKILNTICHLARSMGISTIAEFVDNQDVQNLVEQNQVDHSQGFLFSKPSPL